MVPPRMWECKHELLQVIDLVLSIRTWVIVNECDAHAHLLSPRRHDRILHDHSGNPDSRDAMAYGAGGLDFQSLTGSPAVGRLHTASLPQAIMYQNGDSIAAVGACFAGYLVAEAGTERVVVQVRTAARL